MLDDLKETLRDAARELGFARMGVARAEPLEPEGRWLSTFLEHGRHGSMGWLEATADVRCDPGHPGMLPGAMSVAVLVTPYAREAQRVGPSPGNVARYARGRDYHNVLGKRGRKLAALLREEGYAARFSVDSLPVFERAWAERSGVGFIGKNCCLIVPGMGSHVFLSCLVTTAPLAADAPMKQRCGSCRLCLDACPTDAFVDARQLDARRCISYLTIEHRGPVPEALRSQVGDWVFGCDVCQDVCPYNRTSLPSGEQTEPFAAGDRWDAMDAAGLLTVGEDAFDEWARGSPVKRPGREGMARNAALVLGNTGDKRHLPVLREAAARHSSETVREAAGWALRRLDETDDE